MIDDLKPYSEMKDSGLSWLGRIPGHWDIKRLRFLIRGRLTYGANVSAEFQNRDWPRYIRITDFGPNGDLRPNTFRSLPPDVARDYLVEPGDLLIARSGATVGKAFLVRPGIGPACHAGYLIRARPDTSKIAPRFLFLYTQSDAFRRWKEVTFNIATIQNIGADKYADVVIVLPPLPEQYLIIRFLDHVDRLTRHYVSAKRKLIKLLEEQKQTIVHRVVNPRP